MASNRKATKGVSSGRPRSYSELYRNSREVVANSETAKPGQTASSTVVTNKQDNVEWRNDYGHVMSDIRRLGAITAVLVVAMLVASFFL